MLTDKEVEQLLSAMERNAMLAPVEEFSMKNWLRLFGETGIVDTPIGKVKIGENQFAKMAIRNRAEEWKIPILLLRT